MTWFCSAPECLRPDLIGICSGRPANGVALDQVRSRIGLDPSQAMILASAASGR